MPRSFYFAYGSMLHSRDARVGDIVPEMCA